MKFKYSGLKVNGKKIDKHRHIIETHLKRKLSRQEVVHHKNGNTLDNSIDNLEVMSLSDHARLHMTAHFKKVGFNHPLYKNRSDQKGSNNSQAKLMESDVLFIKTNQSKYNSKELAERFNVSHKQIWEILSGRCWGWLSV